MKKIGTWTRTELLAAAFLLLCFLGSAYLAYRTAPVIFDSDASSTLMYARLVAERGGYLRQDWYYSTGLNLLSAPFVFAPLFRVFSDWSTVRAVGAVILQAVLAASFLFCARQAGVRRSVRLFTAGLVLLPVSVAYARVVLMHSYYAPIIAVCFCLVGLLLGSVREGRSKRGRGAFLGGFLLLSLVSGLGGVRQLLVTLAPLCLVCLYLFLTDERAGGLLAALDRGEKTRRADWRAQLSTASGRGLTGSLLGLAAFFAGYVVNAKVLTRLYSVGDYGSTGIKTPTPDVFGWAVTNMLRVFGFRGEGTAEMFSAVGVASLLGLAVFVCCLALGVRMLRKNSRPESYSLRLLGGLFLSSMLVNIVVQTLTHIVMMLYALPTMILFAALLAAVLEQGAKKPARIQSVLAFLVAGVCLLNAAATDEYLIVKHCGEEANPHSAMLYEGLVHQNPDQVRQLRPAVEFLTENGYTFGYASYWNGNICTEASDGQLRMVNMQNPDADNPPAYYNWLMPKDYPAQARAAERNFLLLTGQEYRAVAKADWLADATPVFEDAYYCVFDIPPDGALVQALIAAG